MCLMWTRKSFFTLLEMLIVMLILSFGAILTGVKVKDLYLEQRFLSEAQQVLSHLGMAQDLMLIMDADVEVKLTYDRKTKEVICWMEVEKPIEEPWKRLIERRLSLSAIRSFQWGEREEDPLTLSFIWGQMSQGTLLLSAATKEEGSRSQKQEFKIELPGYPAPLGTSSLINNEGRGRGREREANPLEKSQSLYPPEIYEELYKKNQNT